MKTPEFGRKAFKVILREINFQMPFKIISGATQQIFNVTNFICYSPLIEGVEIHNGTKNTNN